MSVYFIESKKVCGSQYFIGASWNKDQVRIGLIWWHLVFYFD